MLDKKSSKEDSLNIRIGQKVKEEREKRGWSLTELADNSGVSRAMIHKIERGESSPTAVLLARLSGSFDMTISQLLAQTEVQTGTLVRHENQPVWQDPETGYLRRHVSPARCRSIWSVSNCRQIPLCRCRQSPMFQDAS